MSDEARSFDLHEGDRLRLIVDRWAEMNLGPALRQDLLDRGLLEHRFYLAGSPGLNRTERRALKRALK